MAERVELSLLSSRLAQAAETGETFELVLVLQGKVRSAPRAGRWRLLLDGRHVVTFRAESVIAATPVRRDS